MRGHLSHRLPQAISGSLLFLAVLCAAGCQSRSEYFGKVDPPAGNVLRFNNGVEPEYIDPNLLAGVQDARIAGMIFEGLTVYDERDLHPAPGAAERWEVSSDLTLYTFHLRKGAVWSDGHPLTAHDFVYSWRRILDPKTASRYASMLYYIENGEAFNVGKVKDASKLGVRALDDYTLEVKLRQPVSYFLSLTAHETYMPVPAHVVERYGDRWTDPSHIVGNGPFQLVEHRTNDKFEFIRNPRYWNSAGVKLDRVTAYSVDDNHTAANLYEAGVVDWVPDYIPSDYMGYMRGRFKDLYTPPYLGIYYYAVNITRPPLNNPLVRRALAMGFDRRAITGDLLRAGQIPASHFVPVGFPNYHSPPGPDYNPPEAARLLAEAGYPNGAGFPSVTILINTLSEHRKIAEAVQEMWAKNLNIQVSIRNEEWASYLKDRRSMNYDLARAAWIADYPDPSTFTDLMEGNNGNNDGGWKNPGYDRMIALARQQPEESRRMEILEKAEALLLHDLPVIPVYTYSADGLIKPYVRGVYGNALDRHALNRVWIDRQWKTGRPKSGDEL